MTKPSIEQIRVLEAEEVTVETIPTAATEAASVDPLQTGMTYLRTIDSAPLRIWTAKAPKEVGGKISAVLMQDAGSVLLLHQMPNGKFGVFERKALNP